jgi:hypothetical protein
VTVVALTTTGTIARYVVRYSYFLMWWQHIGVMPLERLRAAHRLGWLRIIRRCLQLGPFPCSCGAFNFERSAPPAPNVFAIVARDPAP